MKHLVTTLCVCLFLSACATHADNTNVQNSTATTSNQIQQSPGTDTASLTKTDSKNTVKKAAPVKGKNAREAVKTMLDGTSVHIADETPNTISIE